MNYTQEQNEIISSNEKILKVNAVAGSGKTTTLLSYAFARKNSSILYLAYNRAIADEIKQKLIKQNMQNVHVTTVHALAYKATNAWEYKFAELDEMRVSKLIGAKNPLYAWLIKDLLSFYCNSRLKALDAKLLENYLYITKPSLEIIKILELQSIEVLGHIKFFLTQMRQKLIPVTHDFYLKLYYLYKPQLNYDVIMVDEAQDISDVMAAIIQMQEKSTVVYVGDSFQQIYGFRFAINALSKIDAASLSLSQSFRFGDWYAKKIQEIINEGYKKIDMPLLNMSGSDKYTKLGYKAMDFSKQFTVISRSNIALFEAVLQRMKDGKKLYFEGGYNGYNFMNKTVFSILKLHSQENEKVEHELISQFESTKDLKSYANDTQNQNLKNMISLVEKHETKLFDFNTKIKDALVEQQLEADIVFSTTHKSKGKEYSQVVMTNDDFVTLDSVKKSMEADDFCAMKVQEELNIFYVAATRVQDVMMLASFEKNETQSDKSFFRKKQMYDFEKEAMQRSRARVATKKEKPAYKKRAERKNEKSMIAEWKKENGY